MQTLDNLLNAGRIEFIDYLKRIPDEIIPQKQELIQSLEMKDYRTQALYNLMAKFMDQLPSELQAKLKQMQPEEMEQEVLRLMGANE